MRVLVVFWPFGSPCDDDAPPDAPMSAVVTVPGKTEHQIAQYVALIIASELRQWYRTNRNDVGIDLCELEPQIKAAGFDPRAMTQGYLQVFGPDLTCHMETASGGA